jgi:hypothetical protein
MMTLRALVIAILAFGTFGVAMAKLPAAAPMTDAQKVAADEKKAKDAAAATLATQQLERSMDRAVANYHADMKAKGKAVPAPQLGAMAAVSAPGKAPAAKAIPAAKPMPAAAPAKK